MGFETYIFAALIAAAIGAVISFVVRAFLENRELDRFFRRVRRSYGGQAFDLRLKDGLYVEDAQIKTYDFGHKLDFSRDALREYSLDNIEVRFGHRKAYLKGIIQARELNGSKRLYSVNGRGEYLKGDRNCGLVMFRMHSNDHEFSWKWVCFLKYANPSEMTGYWISPDTKRDGHIHGGWIVIKEQNL